MAYREINLTGQDVYSPSGQLLGNRNIENTMASAGDASAILAGTGRQASSVASNVPAQNFNVKLLELLKQYQALGTKPYAEQSLNAQETQARRIFNTPADLAGASPEQQSAVRNADVSAVQPTINTAQQSQKTFGEQISGFGDALAQAGAIGKWMQDTEDKKKALAEQEKQDAIDLIFKAPDAAKSMTPEQKKILEKAAGLPSGYIDLIPSTPKKVDISTVDLGDRVAIYKNGAFDHYENKGVEPGKRSGTDDSSTYAADTAQRVVNAVDDLLPRVSGSTVGFFNKLSLIPGTPAADFSADLDYLVSNVGFNALQEMRNASKTGGALGQVSERELALLGATLGALKTNQSPENFKKNLEKVKESVQRWQTAKDTMAPKTTDTKTDPLGIR